RSTTLTPACGRRRPKRSRLAGLLQIHLASLPHRCDNPWPLPSLSIRRTRYPLRVECADLGPRPFEGAAMLHHMMTLTAALLGAALLVPAEAVAQDKTGATWPSPVATRGPVAEKDKKPAPRRTINGMWSALRLGNQSGGVQLKPNNGKPENELPYPPYGLQVYRSHKPLEGIGSVDPADNNDPRTKCEPLGFPRYNHYDLGIQVFQDEHKIAMLYNFDNRWRMIWTDGRPLPKVVDGGVEIDGEYREARWMGYSVGRWIDDYTFEVVTVGTMPEDRVWLGRPGRTNIRS